MAAAPKPRECFLWGTARISFRYSMGELASRDKRNCCGGSIESRTSAGVGRRVLARSCARQLGRNEAHQNDHPLSRLGSRLTMMLKPSCSPTLSRTLHGKPTRRTKTIGLVRAHVLEQNSSSVEPKRTRALDSHGENARAKTELGKPFIAMYNGCPSFGGVRFRRSILGDLSRLCWLRWSTC